MFSTKSHHEGWCFCRVVSYLNCEATPMANRLIGRGINSGDKHIKLTHFNNLTFRMLRNIHFQKWNKDRYNFLTTIYEM